MSRSINAWGESRASREDGMRELRGEGGFTGLFCVAGSDRQAMAGFALTRMGEYVRSRSPLLRAVPACEAGRSADSFRWARVMATLMDRITRTVTKVRRQLPLFRRLWQVPAFLLGLLLLVGVCFLRPAWGDRQAQQRGRDLALA